MLGELGRFGTAIALGLRVHPTPGGEVVAVAFESHCLQSLS
jgi:hypothetical protein